MKILLLITLFFFQSFHLLWAQGLAAPAFHNTDDVARSAERKFRGREIEYKRQLRQQELENQRLQIEYQRQFRKQELENQRREMEIRLRESENQRREMEIRERESENQRRRNGAVRGSQPALQQYEVPNTGFVFSVGNLEKLDKGGTVSLEELIVATLAQADALAKLLIEKGLITEAEFMQKLSEERAVYQTMLQKVSVGTR